MSEISNTESVARILRNAWVIDGNIQHTAFLLRRGETYISVNRPAIQSYDSDVKGFVTSHPDFYADQRHDKYIRAMLNVGEIRAMRIDYAGITLNVNVEVEPRDIFTKSHAGIFTRHQNKNIKNGDTLYIKSLDTDVSADEILLEVRSNLVDISTLESCNL